MGDLEALLGADGGHQLLNVKFFRGSRDLISVEEFRKEFRSALMQRKMKTATVSKSPPKSAHEAINVREFVANL